MGIEATANSKGLWGLKPMNPVVSRTLSSSVINTLAAVWMCTVQRGSATNFCPSGKAALYAQLINTCVKRMTTGRCMEHVFAACVQLVLRQLCGRRIHLVIGELRSGLLAKLTRRGGPSGYLGSGPEACVAATSPPMYLVIGDWSGMDHRSMGIETHAAVFVFCPVRPCA